MLKMIKNDLLGVYRGLGKIYIVALIAAIVGGITIGTGATDYSFYQTTNTPQLTGLIIGISIMVIVVSGIAICIWVYRQTYNTMYKKQGYLTLTLPYSTHKIVSAKILSMWIATLLTGVFMFFCGLILVIVAMLVISGYSFLELGIAFQYIGTAIEQLITALFPDFLTGVLYLAVFVLSGLAAATLAFFFMTFLQFPLTRKMRFLSAILLLIVITYISGVLNSYIFNPLKFGNAMNYVRSTGFEVNFFTILFAGTGSFLETYQVMISRLLAVEVLSNALQIIFYFFGSVFIIDRYIEID